MTTGDLSPAALAEARRIAAEAPAPSPEKRARLRAIFRRSTPVNDAPSRAS